MKPADIIWDVAVIGGGPSGMMAAGRAAELGSHVILLEKNSSLGKKLLITGGGRCNVTNAEFDTRAFLSKFKKNDQFLFSAFTQYGVTETLDFFHLHNMQTKIEAEKRVFPVTDRAASVWEVLVTYMRQGKVSIRYDSTATGLTKSDHAITGIRIKGGETIHARAYILATGGTSRPETGSTGDGFKWLKTLGHTVIDPNPSLVPLTIKDSWVKRLQGISLSNVKLTIFQNNVRQDSVKGKMLFTHFGISGPMVLNASRDIGELLKYGEVTLSLDLFPALDHGALDRTIREILREHNNKKFRNSLGKLIPATIAPIAIELSSINADIPGHRITRKERIVFGKILKAMPMTVTGLLGVKKAIVTSGGVALSEVDFKTMGSRLYSNLYLVGDVLNIDRPSGGYSLQLCWTTGFVAGSSVASIKK